MPAIDAPKVAFLTTMSLIAVLVLVILFAYLTAPRPVGTGCPPGASLVTSPTVECVVSSPRPS